METQSETCVDTSRWEPGTSPLHISGKSQVRGPRVLPDLSGGGGKLTSWLTATRLNEQQELESAQIKIRGCHFQVSTVQAKMF